jgi:RNA polymerase sigma factor (sigma-70 family)
MPASLGAEAVSRKTLRPRPPVAAPATPEPSFTVSHTRWPALSASKWFAEEVQPHESLLRAYLKKQFPTFGDWDDIVQESYLQLLHKREASGEIRFTKAYLFTVARNVALKVIRKQRIFSPLPVNETPACPLLERGSDVIDTVNAHQQDAALAEAIAELPASCREIVKLRAAHGLSYAEIAARRGISEVTVRVQIARGIRKCAQFLRDRGYAP